MPPGDTRTWVPARPFNPSATDGFGNCVGVGVGAGVGRGVGVTVGAGSAGGGKAITDALAAGHGLLATDDPGDSEGNGAPCDIVADGGTSPDAGTWPRPPDLVAHPVTRSIKPAMTASHLVI